MTALRVIRRLLGGGVGATMHHLKSVNFLSSFSVASSCVDYLCQLAVDTSSPDDPVISAAEIVCWNYLRRLTVEISSDQLLSSYGFIIRWDSLWRSAIEIIYEINNRDYLWRSALENICWDQCSRLRLSVEINSRDYMLKVVWQDRLLRLEIEMIYRGQMVRLSVKIYC